MNARDSLAATPPGARVRALATIALAEKGSGCQHRRYLAALETALLEQPPPFDSESYEKIYRDSSEDAGWTAVSLITNAEREGDGAKRLWSLAACSDDDRQRVLLKRHAVDESRHALMYLALLDLTFRDIVDSGFRSELRHLSPHYSMAQDLVPVEGSPYAKVPSIDDFIQMNVAEIRTALHHMFMRPALRKHCSDETWNRSETILDSLLRDELKHVAYTADLIESVAAELDPDLVTRLVVRRFRDFNQITEEELAEGAFDCSVGCCAKRPWCRARASGVGGIH